ncbi:hypothetical protein BAU07_06455 [Bordetella flabilis]|uniref:Uncharacterized protein n=1 Tax=Bordetella flabilis TaxID=463014 RepID=A0A193G9Y5_9BORD|nr:hypothetical protein BAU07_06455 [Bordetella flabilis]
MGIADFPGIYFFFFPMRPMALFTGASRPEGPGPRPPPVEFPWGVGVNICLTLALPAVEPVCVFMLFLSHPLIAVTALGLVLAM